MYIKLGGVVNSNSCSFENALVTSISIALNINSGRSEIPNVLSVMIAYVLSQFSRNVL